MKEITEAIQGMVLENSKMSVEQIAEAAFGFDEHGKPRKSRWTLYREVNPEDAGAKLGALDLVKLMEATGCYKPLEAIAGYFEITLDFMAGGAPDGKDMDEECLQEFMAAAAFVKAAKDGRTSYVELLELFDDLKKEAEDVIKRKRAEQTGTAAARKAS